MIHLSIAVDHTFWDPQLNPTKCIIHLKANCLWIATNGHCSVTPWRHTWKLCPVSTLSSRGVYPVRMALPWLRHPLHLIQEFSDLDGAIGICHEDKRLSICWSLSRSNSVMPWSDQIIETSTNTEGRARKCWVAHLFAAGMVHLLEVHRPNDWVPVKQWHQRSSINETVTAQMKRYNFNRAG